MKTINSIAGKYNVDIEKAKELLEKKGVDISDINAELDLESEMLVEEILSVQQRFVQIEKGLKPGKMIETREYPTYESNPKELFGCSTLLWIFVVALLVMIIVFFASLYGKAKSEEIPKSERPSSSSQQSNGLSEIEDESSSTGNLESIGDEIDLNRSFSWYDEENGKQWQYDAEFSQEIYDELALSELTEIVEIASDNRAYQYLADIVNEFNLAFEDDENVNQITSNMIISFVQGLDYSVPDESKIRAKFAYETLYDKCGDDEDMAILLASLLKLNGNDAVILRFEGRTGVGLVIDNSEIESVSFEYNEKNYYYIDTVAGNYEIGAIPEEYAGIVPEIIDFEITASEE